MVLFVHGGGFVGGEKSDPTLPYYDHVGAWAVRAGLAAVTMTYRLAPGHPWPAGAQDVAAGLRWTRDHIARHGGDPDRIVLVGHSAGAAHAAGYLTGHGEHDGPAAAGRVAGAVLLSGSYDPAIAEPSPMLEAYYGDSAGRYPERSVVPGLVACERPLLIGVAELDPPEFHRQAMVLLDAQLAAHGVIPSFVTILDHTHLSRSTRSASTTSSVQPWPASSTGWRPPRTPDAVRAPMPIGVLLDELAYLRSSPGAADVSPSAGVLPLGRAGQVLCLRPQAELDPPTAQRQQTMVTP